MEKSFYLLSQLEESKAFILSGKVPQLRMTLILLDNAVEILMYRKVTDELSTDEYVRIVYERAKEMMPQDEFERFIQEHKISPISPNKREKILWYFGEKVKFLKNIGGNIDELQAKSLLALHKYRNETYHKDIIKRGVISPVVKILFELACDLFVSLYNTRMTYSSDMELDEYYKRYNIPPKWFLGDDDAVRIADELKNGVVLDTEGLAGELKIHIESRLSEVQEMIEFVRYDGLRDAEADHALKWIQFIQAGVDHDPFKPEEEFEQFKAPYDMGDFERWSDKAKNLKCFHDKYALFNEFIQFENEFEPLEAIIMDAATELDRAIQHAIDIARGK